MMDAFFMWDYDNFANLIAAIYFSLNIDFFSLVKPEICSFEYELYDMHAMPVCR